MTVARRLARNFPGLATGADIAFYSNLPRSAGLSTSSALITAVYLVLASVNDLPSRADFQRRCPRTSTALAGYLGSIENGTGLRHACGRLGVGTAGGQRGPHRDSSERGGRARQLPLSSGDAVASAARSTRSHLRRRRRAGSWRTRPAARARTTTARPPCARALATRGSESTGRRERRLPPRSRMRRDATEKLRAAVAARAPDGVSAR